jgi:predicted RNA-binding Zn ribbon-like protein
VRNASALVDLLNTTPVVDGAVVDRLAEQRAATEWLALHGGGAGDRKEVAALLSVRSDLQAVVRGERPADILNAVLDGVEQRPVIGPEGLRWILSTPENQALAVRIVLEWASVTQELPGRLRPCANQECNLFLLDRSRANSARWCSMAVCGNRLKARRHQARQAVG